MSDEAMNNQFVVCATNKKAWLLQDDETIRYGAPSTSITTTLGSSSTENEKTQNFRMDIIGSKISFSVYHVAKVIPVVAIQMLVLTSTVFLLYTSTFYRIKDGLSLVPTTVGGASKVFILQWNKMTSSLSKFQQPEQQEQAIIGLLLEW